MTKFINIACASILLTLVAACSQAPADAPSVTDAAWTVDNAGSKLSYVSVKAGDVAEANVFEKLSGSVGSDGAARIDIDLASVNTGVDIRDERMREVFFNVAENPTATVSAKLDPAAFEALAVGESVSQELDATLSLKGLEAPARTTVTVTRVAADRILAVSDAPVIISADSLDLAGGLAKLQELAGLPSITPVVPVSFSIAFDRQ
jgi:polyisoprenoid-binding protein YceI